MAELQLCGENLPQKQHHAIAHFNGPDGAMVSILNDECFKCSYWDTCILDGKHNEVHLLTNEPNSFKYIVENKTIAEGKHYFEPLGVYNVHLKENSTFQVDVLQEPTSWEVRIILTVAIVLLPLFIDRFFELLSQCYKWCKRNDEEPPAENQSKRERFLDNLRGYALILMIFVNYGGGGLSQFAHSAWFGLTVADTVFPLFMYAAGCAMYCIDATQQFKVRYWYKMNFKFLRLIFIGILISNTDGGPVRLPGVLQRIGFCLMLLFLQHGVTYCILNRVFGYTEKVNHLHLFFAAEFAVIYLVTAILPVGDCPLLYAGPGGISENGEYFNCTGGFSGWLDRHLFGPFLYTTPTCKELYHTVVPFDPEGIHGSLGAMITICGGYCAMKLICCSDAWKHKAFAGITFLLIPIGFISSSGGDAPMCKNLWNLPFVLVNLVIDNVLLYFFYYFHKRYAQTDAWKFKILGVFGRNSLLIYTCHEFLAGRFPLHLSVGPSTAMQVLNSTWGVIFHVLLILILERGKFSIRFDLYLGFDKYRRIPG